MIKLNISLIEQDLVDLELQVFMVGKGYYESVGRSFVDDKLVAQDGNGNDMPNMTKTDYRQEARFDDELQAYWIKSASNFGLDPAISGPLQAIAYSYDSVTTIDHEFSTEEEA
jgi:hypothetical protein